MKRTTSGVDRLVTLVVAIALIVGGALLVCWRYHVGFVRDLFRHADRNWYAVAPQQSWWDWTLAAVAVGATVAGIVLLVANIAPKRITVIDLGDADTLGTTTVNGGQLGSAIAAALQRHPAIAAASASSSIDRGTRTLRVTMTAEPEVPLEHLRHLAARCVADLRNAFGDIDIDTQFFVRYLPAGEH